MASVAHTPGCTCRRSRRLGWLVALCACLCVALGSCSTKKNTAASRNYNAFITRYNIYYNGDTHYRETLEQMEDKYEDDYSRLVFMHPVEAKADPQAPQPSGNFDRSIEKGQKAIQLRSIKKRPKKKPGKNGDPAYQAWLKRDEYNPFLHNAWMMMGRGQFFNGDFLGAASTFFYISRHFSWLPATVTEAKLWQARSYVALDWLYDAELILSRIRPDQLTTPELRTMYAYVDADRLIRGGSYAEAVEPLREAIKGARGAQRTRLRFLLGQVLERIGRRKEAYEAFAKAGSASSASYRTKFNARIKQSEVFDGADIAPEVKSLKSMTRYDRNKDYIDQIYYAIGNLYMSRGDTAHAIENYRLAAEKSTRNGIDKAMSQLRLGGIYFDRREYSKAQPCYSEAVPQLPDNYPDYKNIKRRSDVLDELAVYSQNVELQDSLLRLSAMSEEDRMAAVQRIIDELIEREKKEAEEARRAEYDANVAANGQGANSGANAPNSFNINTDNSWYFYNQSAKQAGRTEFQKRWGSRRLEDDWRRRNKNSFNNAEFDAAGSESDQADGSDQSDSSDSTDSAESPDSTALEAANDPHKPEYYLRQIPMTDEERATCHEIIQEGLYNMGVILKDKLEDYPAARAEWERLLRDYIDNVYRLDVYYNMYLMHARRGETAEAERWRQLLMADFPESTYGVALRDPAYLDNLRQMDSRQQALYDATLEAYFADDNAAVHAGRREMEEKYPLSPIMPKFMFLDALAYVTDRRPDDFNATLRDLLNRYPDTDITPIASAWLKGMAQGRELQSGAGGNMRGMIWDTRLTADSTAVDSEAELAFTLDPQSRQLLVMLFPTDSVSSNLLLYEIARHNFRSFVVKDFELEPMNFGRLGMIVIRDFANMDELDHYRRVMAASPDFRLPAGVRPVVISAANFETLLRAGRSFDDYFRYLDEQNYVDAQAGLLQPEQIETLPEADAAAEAEAAGAGTGTAPEGDTEASGTAPEPDDAAIEEYEDTEIELITPAPAPAPVPAAPAPAPVPVPPAPAPATVPVPPVPAPATVPQPLPDDGGSEGDDPLFD